MKRKYGILSLLLLILNFTFPVYSEEIDLVKESMQKYCAVPPFMETSFKPNIYLVFDYSGSMAFLAYHSYGTVTYNKNINYYGYFKPNKCYKYDNIKNYWVENTSSSCNCSDGVGNSNNCLSGNLLNYLVTSRIDAYLKAMIGGKTLPCGTNELCLVNRNRGYYFKVRLPSGKICRVKIIGSNNSSRYNSSSGDSKFKIYGSGCPIRWSNYRYLRIKINPEEKIGILQKNQDLGNFALIVFGRDSGKIKVGLHEYKQYGMDYLIKKIEEQPPGGWTPQNAALYETMDYIMQRNAHNYANNSSYIARGTYKDPFWEDKLKKIIPCKTNVIILVSDGEWNYTGDPLKAAYYLHTRDLRNDLNGKQSANIFTLFTFSYSSYGLRALRSIAAAGSFIDLDGDNKPFEINLNANSKYIRFPRPRCNPSRTYRDECKEWDGDRNGIPDNSYFASNGKEVERAMSDIMAAINKYNYSGGSLGVLGKRSKENSMTGIVLEGTVLAQPLFYSQKYGINWIGKIYGYWYYLGNSTIREDTNSDNILTFSIDKILEFGLENDKDLVVYRYNVDAIGTKTTLDAKFYDPDDVNYLFELGYDLWQNYDESNDSEEDDRKIYFAACEKGEDCLKEFKYDSLSKFVLEKSYGSGTFKIPLLGMPGECFNMCNYFDNMMSFDMFGLWDKFIDCINQNNDYDKLVKYIRGKDYEGFRTRTIEGKVWKLGDIIYSSPQIVTYSNNESYLFVGANDGMLHVFKLGKLERRSSGGQVVELKENEPKKEVWAFIPLNVLPYLRFLADPDYCHLYYVDLSPQIVRAHDGRIILVGGLRLGAATASTGESAINPPGWACPASFWNFIKDSCKTCMSQTLGFSFMCNFIPTTPPDYSSCIGLSSYFAIDITDPENPKFLWEFTHPDLGFAYSGPTFIYKRDKTYVMFGSGPINYQGDSDLNLKYFVINLDGSDLNNPVIIDTGIRNAFSGRMNIKGLDIDNDRTTDFVFVGYARKDGDMNNWKGGLIVFDTRDDNPLNWSYDTYFADAQGPLTAKVEFGKCFNKTYVYFGSGRWFYKLDNPLSGQKERLYGVPFVCKNVNGSLDCYIVENIASNPDNVCTDASNGVLRGWYRELELGNSEYLKERNITEPVLTNQNVILFTTMEPTSDVCKFGGRTRIWALNCATGGSLKESCPVYPINPNALTGTTLLQLSGGNIEKISLKNIPNQTTSGETTQWFTGTAPESGPSFVNMLPPKGEIILWLER
jgi:type IV pilus assembly protein PilY1